MTADEHKPQSVINQMHLILRFAVAKQMRELSTNGIEPGTPTQLVDGAKAASGNKPGAGTVRHALAGPLLRCGEECFVQGFLGQVEIAQQPNERCQHLTRVLAPHRIECIGAGGEMARHAQARQAGAPLWIPLLREACAQPAGLLR